MNFVDLNEADFSYWQSIYYEAFPANEIIDFDQLIKLQDNDDDIHLVTIKQADQAVGIMLYVEMAAAKKGFVLFLAIDAAMRGQNLGTQVLEELKNRYPQGVILECEMLDATLADFKKRKRRYEFYIRNGFEDSGFISHNSDDRFHLLRSNSAITIEDYALAAMKFGIKPLIATK